MFSFFSDLFDEEVNTYQGVEGKFPTFHIPRISYVIVLEIV